MKENKLTKAATMELAEKYSMEIIRNPITSEAWGVTVESDEPIPELDKYADAIMENEHTAVERVNLGGTYRYTITCPTSWFDLWGWR